MDFLHAMRNEVRCLDSFYAYGRVVALHGASAEVRGLERFLSMGDLCYLEGGARPILCEVVAQTESSTHVMPFGSLHGIGVGSRAVASYHEAQIYPDSSWLGRVVGAMGEVRDTKGSLKIGDEGYALCATPPAVHLRRPLGEKVLTGVRAIDAFTPCCRGQRLGIFSGSGIGKSILLSMIARHAEADVIVVGLIGERSRELKEFIARGLGERGLQRSVVVVSTAEEPALARRQAAWATLAIAEYFRDQGKEVLCLIDSLTRFAVALREIHLCAGEPVTLRGYTPSVFAEMPRLLERAGPGIEKRENIPGFDETTKDNGNITGLFTVLVEGDDHDEPVSDALRGILDGHITLSREIAHRGRYPAIDILRSVSRSLPEANSREENAVIEQARRVIAAYESMEDLIKLGTYRKGSDQLVDLAIRVLPEIEDRFLGQGLDEERRDFVQIHEELGKILFGRSDEKREAAGQRGEEGGQGSS